MDQYFAIHIKTGYELKVRSILLKNYSSYFNHHKVQIIIPRNELDNDIGQKKEKAGLSGYLIIKCVELTDDLYYKFKSTIGVIRVIRENIPAIQMQNFCKSVKMEASICYKKIVKELAEKKYYLNLMFKKNFKNKKVSGGVNLKKGIQKYITILLFRYLN